MATLSSEKAKHRRHFDQAAAGWRKWRHVLEPAYAPISEALLDAAAVREGAGQWVLDLACGLGDTSFAAARRVGPAGRVVGIDLAPRMVALAEERARSENASTVGFRELDAETLSRWPEGAYEAAVSRFGVSFFPDVDVAVRGVHRVLTPGARFAAANWGDPQRVPLMSLARQVVARLLGDAFLPPLAGPGPFALAAPGRLEQALSSAGFRRIQGEHMALVIDLPSAAAYADMLRDVSSLATALAEQTTIPADEVWQAIAREAEGKLPLVCDVRIVSGAK
jgi:SAM-dependent methyltransferase